MGRGRRWAVVAIAAGTIVSWPSDASAACHAFEIEVAAPRVGEGGAVTVTVSRDAGLNPSTVEVVSIDETATGGQDFTPVNRSVSFTTETAQTFQVPTTDDRVDEPAETFVLRLRNPSGCAINPNFSLGPDARVTIEDNDQASATTAPATTAVPTTVATATTTRTPDATAAATTTTESDDDTTTSEDDPDTTTTTASSLTGAASGDADEDDDDGAGAVLLILAAIVAVLGAAAYTFVRWRRSVSP